MTIIGYLMEQSQKIILPYSKNNTLNTYIILFLIRTSLIIFPPSSVIGLQDWFLILLTSHRRYDNTPPPKYAPCSEGENDKRS